MLAHHIIPVLITLLSASPSFATTSSTTSSVPPAFPVKSASHLPLIDAAVACNQLKETAPKLLAHLDDEPLTITNAISLIYAEGANPSTTALVNLIPHPILQPAANIPGAINSIGEWTKADVVADLGYGQEDTVQSGKGGLPAFCRFGASITTSKMSNVWFEVWMPLPSNTTISNTTSTTSSHSSTSLHASTVTLSHSSSSSHALITSHTSSSSHHSSSSATVKAKATAAYYMQRRWQRKSSSHKKSTKKKSSKTSSKKSSTKKKSTSTEKKHTTSTKKTTSTTKKSTSTSSNIKTMATATSTAPVAGRACSSRWRGRVVSVGGSGQLGGPNYPEMKQVLTRYHEVAVSTNAGHWGSGSLSNWTIGNPQAQLDFGQRGIHVASIASQAIVKSFYGIADRTNSDGDPRYGFNTYFKGCSTGGRQGFVEAQAYEKDYDGIIAGSPAVYYNDLNAYQIHVNYLQSNSSSPSYIPLTLYPLIHEHIINQCDPNDGVRDAVIQDPSSCQPDFDQLLCPTSNTTTANSTSTAQSSPVIDILVVSNSTARSNGTSTANATATCLTQAQIDNLAKIYTALTYPDGTIIHEPVLYGSEFSWTVTDGVVGTPFPPAPGWFQYQVLNLTTNASSFDPYTVVEGNFSLIALGNRNNPGRTNTENADLTSFFRRGSKLIHYHGLADQLIPSGASDRFFHSVHSSSSSHSISDSYRYFHIPGMAHCRGGDGAYNFGGASQTANAGSRPLQYDADHDMLVALFRWTENGVAPDYIIGAAYKNAADEAPYNIGLTTDQRPYSNGVKFTHKMCPYPQQAVLTDASNPYDAASLTCEYPS